jgi:hypothetical protein
MGRPRPVSNFRPACVSMAVTLPPLMTARSLTLRHGAIALAAAAGLAAGAHPAAPAAASAIHAARVCSPPEYPGNGYFTSLRVRHTTCRKGRKLARAHYRCRTKHGIKGHCHHRVLHYRCKERRPSSSRIPTQYSAEVTCRHGHKRVVFDYQQNT